MTMNLCIGSYAQWKVCRTPSVTPAMHYGMRKDTEHVGSSSIYQLFEENPRLFCGSETDCHYFQPHDQVVIASVSGRNDWVSTSFNHQLKDAWCSPLARYRCIATATGSSHHHFREVGGLRKWNQTKSRFWSRLVIRHQCSAELMNLSAWRITFEWR
jgi:hypothetical protein